MTTLDFPGDFIDGRFRSAEAPDGEIIIASPGDQADIVGRHHVSLAHVDEAVGAARAAFPAWRRTPRAEREALLRRYQEVVRKYEDEITEAIAREVGKPLWDARGEAKALAAKVDLMLGEGARFTRDEVFADIPGAIRYRPHGVLAVLGPFNFPVHLPNGQIIPALLHGNTVVFKPSDKTPTVAVWMARCYEEAGFPPGVFNLVQGEVATAEKLVDHPDVDGILFTGSAPVGKAILAKNADRPGRIVALELGGKNPSIVLDDADVARAVNQIAFAAYATGGQRCTATSRILATPKVIDQLVEGLAAKARELVVGYPLDEDVFMGPLIRDESRARLFEAQARARAAGIEAVVPGGAAEVSNRNGWYARPAVHRAPQGDIRVEGYTHDELFGPDVCVYPVADVDEAIARANDTRYGLAAAVFTEREETFEAFADALKVGVLHWNQSSAGASGRLPFGGVNESGNHRPAGIFAGLFTTWAQAVRFRPEPDSALPTWPGMPR